MPFAETFSYYASATRDWVRSLLTREAMFDGVRTGAWVIPLTVLIWIYAEQQQRTDDKLQIPVNIRSTDPDRIISLPRGADLPMVDVRGPKSAIEDLKADLNRAGDNRLIDIDVPDSLPPG